MRSPDAKARGRRDADFSAAVRRRLFCRSRNARAGRRGPCRAGARARPRRVGRVHRRLCRRRHRLARGSRNGPQRARRRLRRTVRCAEIRGRRLSPLCRMEDGDCAGRGRGDGARRVARLAGLSRLAVADARQSEGDDLLSFDHAARRRRESADAARDRRTRRALRDRHVVHARGLRARREPRPRAVPFGPRHALRPCAAGGALAGVAVAVATR